MHPREFLNQANSMIMSPNSPEVDRRTAISRAYYYLFNETRDFLSSNPKYQLYEQANSSLGSHERIGKFLGRVNFAVGQIYTAFKRDRNLADYDLKKKFFSQTDCQTKIAGMVQLVSAIKGLTI